MGSGRRMAKWWWALAKYEVGKRWEKVLMWIAWHLPKELVKWCYVRVGSHATTGKYGNTEVPAITMMDALQRWDNDECGA